MSRVHRDVGAWHNELLGHQGHCVDGEPLDAALLLADGVEPTRRDQEGERPLGSSLPPQLASFPRSSSAVVAKYPLTPDSTVLAMVLEVLVSCNLEMPAGSCCPFHGCLEALVKVCVGLRSRGCKSDWLAEDLVCGQCSACGALFPEDGASSWQQSSAGILNNRSAVHQCTFCNAVLNSLSSSTGVVSI